MKLFFSHDYKYEITHIEYEKDYDGGYYTKVYLEYGNKNQHIILDGFATIPEIMRELAHLDLEDLFEIENNSLW